MSEPVIYFFVKTFSKKQRLEDFLDGSLCMNSLDYFVNLEQGDSTGRGDRHEGVYAWFQPSDIQLAINGFSIDSADLAAPTYIQSKEHLAKNVFCMHAGYIGGQHPSAFETIEAFEDAVKIPVKNISLGQYSAVLTDVKEFIGRVKTAAQKQDVRLSGRLVDYYDPVTFSGHFDEHEVPFKKQVRFEYQREYRLVIDRPRSCCQESRYFLDVGSLRDIAHEISIDALNAGIKKSPIQRR